jgi:hypothetical protein
MISSSLLVRRLVGYVCLGALASECESKTKHCALLVEADGANDDLGDGVGVRVAGRAPVLKVARLLGRDGAWNADAGASVGDTW